MQANVPAEQLGLNFVTQPGISASLGDGKDSGKKHTDQGKQSKPGGAKRK
jgi:hypothetical protein